MGSVHHHGTPKQLDRLKQQNNRNILGKLSGLDLNKTFPVSSLKKRGCNVWTHPQRQKNLILNNLLILTKFFIHCWRVPDTGNRFSHKTSSKFRRFQEAESFMLVKPGGAGAQNRFQLPAGNRKFPLLPQAFITASCCSGNQRTAASAGFPPIISPAGAKPRPKQVYLRLLLSCSIASELLRIMKRIALLLVLTWAAPAARCYPSGLVSESCADMTPNHSAAPQTTTAPFTVSVERSGTAPGGQVKVSLQGPSSGPFTGFLLEAREPGGQSAVGSFLLGSGPARLLTCFQKLNSAVSHSSASPKTNIQVTWQPDPDRTVGVVQFQASFVQSYRTFWVGVKSPVLSLNGSQAADTATLSPGSTPISNVGCGSTKLCFNQPLNCNPSISSNCFFMSAKLLTPPESGVRYELSGPGEGYIAFGWSDDQKMGEDDIYICGLSSAGGVDVQRAFSVGRKAPTVQSKGNVSDIQTSNQNGVLTCTFTSKNAIFTSSSSSFSSNKLFYLLLAYGPSTNGTIMEHQKAYSSSQQVALTSTDVIQSDGKEQMIRAHGCLMLLAWMTLGPLGMVVARYLRRSSQVQMCGKDLWFVIHVSVMSFTVVITIIAFILAFAYLGGWEYGVHPVLGCLVLTLTLIQPILALMRCAPQHPRRFLFNWAHFVIAVSLKLLAVATVFTGMMMMDSSGWLTKVLGGFTGWEALLLILMELQARWRSAADGSDPVQPDTVGRDVLLVALFLTGNLSFLIALLAGIGQAVHS
ncbi:putative ferric-chelate reductase 1 [Xiphophorus maculatus]|nr:putative ferric-chelate reductase 1 [Xiphophorus maculatus]